jgi:hypothetical protein
VVLKAIAKAPEQRFTSAAELRQALLAVPLDHDEDDDDITTALFVRDVQAPARAEPIRRTWIVPAVFFAVLVLVLGTVGYLFLSRSNTGRNLIGSSGTRAPSAQPAQIVGADAFDPQGDGIEHNADLPKLFDGNPATAWSTEHYDAGLRGVPKQGVGFVLLLKGTHRLGHLQVTSPNRGWTASVYVADGPKANLQQWGAQVGSHVVDGTASFDLHARQGGAVLFWITDLGGNQSVSVSEVRLTN